MASRLGKFELLHSLGQGAMGEVFLARDPAIGREVAVKTILAASTAGAGAKERFAREAQAAGALSHPGIVTIHEFGEDAGVLYLAMEYVDGDDLQALLMGRSLPKAELLEALAQVSEALAYAHRRGVLHRDVKPSNIRLSREGGRLQAKLMDFGIARIAESTLTSAGLLMGTVAYMAPEYVKTGQADNRADLFAVGVMLYEGLAGQLPFAGDTTATILYRLVHEAPKPLPSSALAGASPALRGVLDRALAKDPEGRYADGDALAAALRAAKDPAWPGDGAPTVAMGRPVPATEPPAPGRGRMGWIASAAVVLLALGGFAWRRHQNRVMPPVPAPAPKVASLPAPSASVPVPAVQVASKPDPKPAPPVLKPSKPEPPAPEAPEPVAENPEPPASDAAVDPPSAIAAAERIASDPAQAHRDFTALIQAHPANPHLRALDLLALERSGDGAGFIKAWDAAAAAGIDPKAMLLTPRYAAMLREQKRDPTLPPEALERLSQAYGTSAKVQRRWERRAGD